MPGTPRRKEGHKLEARHAVLGFDVSIERVGIAGGRQHPRTHLPPIRDVLDYFAEKLPGLEDVDKVPVITEGTLALGYSQLRIGKITGRNLFR